MVRGRWRDGRGAAVLARRRSSRGGDWIWLEYPRHITFVAAVLGMAACFARTRLVALAVLAGTAAFALAWELVAGYRNLASLGRTDLFVSELGLLVRESVGRVAPWLVGGAYAVLALLAITRSDDPLKNRQRAALWLVGVALVALAFTLLNKSWLTLENLSGRGVFRSSEAWPDTKKIALSLDLVALAAGLVGFLYTPPEKETIPRATLRR